MKVFISWSGKRSKAMANALKEWIPLIVQHAEPFVSDKDISAGDRWAQAIAGELESSNFGILCITPENISSEWIMFEAGALSKAMQDAKVIPLLFGLELSDLSGPLQQFQALKVDEQGMLDALKAINVASDNKTGDGTIEQLVPALWSQLQEKLDAIPAKAETEKHMRPQTEIMEDLVSQVRGLNSRMRDFDPEVMERDIEYRERRYRDIHPKMIDELMYMSMERGELDMSLLVISGMVRERMPWIADVLVEAHREIRSGTPENAREVAHSVMRTIDFMVHSPLGEKLIGRSKSAHMLARELPHMVDRAISHQLEIGRVRIADQIDKD